MQCNPFYSRCGHQSQVVGIIYEHKHYYQNPEHNSPMHKGKHAAAIAAVQLVKPDSILGVGTGSTVDIFIDELAAAKIRLDGAVASRPEHDRLARHVY